MADLYGVASMTAQRALRELQHRRITYSVAGKGTFVHPDAFDLLRGGALREPIDDPDLNRRIAAYLADQQTIVTRYHTAEQGQPAGRGRDDPFTNHPRQVLLGIDAAHRYAARHRASAATTRALNVRRDTPIRRAG
jgi:hypothetical protein